MKLSQLLHPLALVAALSLGILCLVTMGQTPPPNSPWLPAREPAGCCSTSEQPTEVLSDSLASASLGRCTGSPNCRVCSNCSRCAWCKGGGTCGVCAPSHSPPRSTPPPAPIPANSPAPASAAAEDGIAVYFSPNGHCTDAIVQEIKKAKQSIRLLAYRLASPPMDFALLDARERGASVSIVLDGTRQTAHPSDATHYANLGVPVLIDSAHLVSHNSFLVIDESVIVTGSFDFTTAAETSNAENLLVIQNKPALAKAYLTEFQRHLTHSSPYQPPPDGDGSKK